MDAKLRYKAKKIKIVFFDIDDTLRNSKTGFIPASIPTVFKQLREKGILTGIASGRGIFGVVPEIRELKPDFFVTLSLIHISVTEGAIQEGSVVSMPLQSLGIEKVVKDKTLTSEYANIT